jgi:hypothetical protein
MAGPREARLRGFACQVTLRKACTGVLSKQWRLCRVNSSLFGGVRVPGLARVAVLSNPLNPSMAVVLEQTKAATQSLGIKNYASSRDRVGRFWPISINCLLLFCRCGHVGNALALSIMSTAVSPRMDIVDPRMGRLCSSPSE